MKQSVWRRWLPYVAIALLFGGAMAVGAWVYVQGQQIRTYENSAAGFTIQYRAAWELQEGEQVEPPAILRVFNSKTFEDEQGFTEDEYKAALAVDVVDLPAETATLDEIMEGTISELREGLEDFEIIESAASTLSSTPARKIVFKGTYPGESSRAQGMQVVAINNGKVYGVSYLGSEEAAYSYFLKDAEEMIASFQIH